MKRWLIVLLVGGLCGAASAQKPQIQVSAKRKVDSDGRTTSSYSSYSSKEQRQMLDISVRNLDRTPRDCEVAWYFTARPAGGGERYIYDRGTQAALLGASAATNLTAAASPLQSTKMQFYGDGRARRTGAEAEGYFVVVSVGGEVVSSIASSRPLQQLISKPQTLQQLIESARDADHPSANFPGAPVREGQRDGQSPSSTLRR